MHGLTNVTLLRYDASLVFDPSDFYSILEVCQIYQSKDKFCSMMTSFMDYSSHSVQKSLEPDFLGI
jgi:hypothetical protein